ncbi:hypothetical protein [Paenibacillus azoreducens]|uniref:hypothetical protein n=1 Tax=Paenibacillus azoreducens TaxID=116718 RepID=UPI001BB36194|nr:hypothetical protein [Paenibacillus azoreducens]
MSKKDRLPHTKLFEKIQAALNAGLDNQLTAAAFFPLCHLDGEHEWKRSKLYR